MLVSLDIDIEALPFTIESKHIRRQLFMKTFISRETPFYDTNASCLTLAAFDELR